MTVDRTPQKSRDIVVLLHGLWMSPLVMRPLARALSRAGYSPVSLSFRSVRGTLEENLAVLEQQLDRHLDSLNKGSSQAPGALNFVGHSMGGVLALELLRRRVVHGKALPGRVLLLGAPVTGCESALRLSRRMHGRFLLGRTLSAWPEHLRTNPPLEIPPGCETGSIAGTGHFGLGMLFVRLEGEHDGVVCVPETRPPGLADHITLQVSHSGMLLSPEVARQSIAFLRKGAFARGA